MVDFAVAITVFAELHGHGPFDALAPALLDMLTIVFLGLVLGKISIGLDEGRFHFFSRSIEWKRG